MAVRRLTVNNNKRQSGHGQRLLRGVRSRSLTIIIYLFLAAISVTVFGQTIRYDFVNFDDDLYVYDTLEVSKGLTINGILAAFTHPHAHNWHPLTTISHMLDCQLYGLNAGGHKNQNQTMEECYKVLQSIHAKADAAGIPVVVYISMAFGNPYGDPWDENEVHQATKKLTRIGVRSISLADTVGAADADLIRRVVESVTGQCPDYDIGVHLHSAPGEAEVKVLAAYDAGCRRFDSAIGGVGGCPLSQDVLVGDSSTESVIAAIEKRGIALEMSKTLADVLTLKAEIAASYA